MRTPSLPAHEAPAGAALPDDPAVVTALLEGLAHTDAAVCLCDEHDHVRYVNPAFRDAFFPDAAPEPGEFMAAIEAAIVSGRGIKLDSMPLESFAARVRARRREGPARHSFCVDLHDGRWWWVTDRRLANGWILVVASDISSIKTEELRLRGAHADAVKASRTDFLTGLPNRRHGMEQAEAVLAEARQRRAPMALALIDIDHFKSINDTHGHETGDEVLRHFALALARLAGPHDLSSRIGGEEFMIVMPDTPLERAQRRLERLGRALRPLDRGAGRPPLRFSFSGGVASPGPTESLRSLLTRADAALYAAKMKGRGRVEASREASSDAA